MDKLAEREAQGEYLPPETEVEVLDAEQEIDPLLDRLNRMEEVMRQYIEAIDGLSRAIGHVSNEIFEVKMDVRKRIRRVNEILGDHNHDQLGNVRVSSYLIEESNG